MSMYDPAPRTRSCSHCGAGAHEHHGPSCPFSPVRDEEERIFKLLAPKYQNAPEGPVAPLPGAQAACQDEVVNPKEIAGSKKPATWSVMPRWIMLLVGRVMSVGAAKYGPFNYRESRITSSIYQDALERHLQLWFDGEDNDPETGVSHLASAIAGCALLLDAQATGKLVDDRQKTGLARRTLDDLQGLLATLPLPAPQH